MVKHKFSFYSGCLWRERFLALATLLNLILVFFDISYLTYRNFYLQNIPTIPKIYDRVKGIKQNRKIEIYLQQVDGLQALVIVYGLQSLQVKKQLGSIRLLSRELIEDNFFTATDKSFIISEITTKIKQKTAKKITLDAFDTFWSQVFFNQVKYKNTIYFWRVKIKPLIHRIYSREISQVGGYLDYFWLLELPFIVIFTIDITERIIFIKYSHPYFNWQEAILRRWYDLFLLLPFWQFLQIIPVSIRMYDLNFFNLKNNLKFTIKNIRNEMHNDFIICVAAKLTEIIGIQAISKMQSFLQTDDAMTWLFHPKTHQTSIEAENITTNFVNVIINDALVKVDSDIKDLVHHSISSALKQTLIYQQLQYIPGVENLPAQLTENVAQNLAYTTYNTENVSRLIKSFGDVLEAELREQGNFYSIQSLLVDFLEKIKIIYLNQKGTGNGEWGTGE